MKKEMSDHALCAKQIREMLKKDYPTLKCRVRSSSYSMGDSVTIYLPSSLEEDDYRELYDEIETKTRKHQYGHFNGMEDIYEYDNVDSSIGQTKYLFIELEWRTK